MALDFRETDSVVATLFTDPGRRSYDALGATRGVAAALDPRTVFGAIRSFGSGNVQTTTAGDARQQGGELVMRPDGTVAFLHLARFAGDHADVDAVIAAV